jgi:hypothetical protein
MKRGNCRVGINPHREQRKFREKLNHSQLTDRLGHSEQVIHDFRKTIVCVLFYASSLQLIDIQQMPLSPLP